MLALAQEYIRTLDGYENGIVTAYHMPCEVMVPTGQRMLFDVGDNHSSRHTAMGLLYASLNDPRWLDPTRIYSDEGGGQ